MAEQKDKKKIGYTWYPRDWWSSTTYFNCDDLGMRGVIREVFDLMHLNGGHWIADRKYLSKLIRTPLTDEFWNELKSYFIIMPDSSGVEFWYHKGVTDRLISPDKIKANQENGAKGGRPTKPKNNPTETQELTQSITQEKPNKPTLLIEDKVKENININLNVNESLYDNRTSESVVSSQPLSLEGSRLELHEFEAAYAKLGDQVRPKAVKLWNKLSDVETREAGFYFKNYVTIERLYERKISFSDFIKKRWWRQYLKDLEEAHQKQNSEA